MDTKTRFEKEAKGNSEMAYCICITRSADRLSPIYKCPGVAIVMKVTKNI